MKSLISMCLQKKGNCMRKIFLSMVILAFIPLSVFAQSQEFSAGEAVITHDPSLPRRNGIIQQVFPDGVARVRITEGNFKGEISEYYLEELAKPVNCVKGICANDLVVVRTPSIAHRNGIVKQVFPDGFARVLITEGNFTGEISEYDIGGYRDVLLMQKCSEAGGTDCHQ